jgi:hypothetical protein
MADEQTVDTLMTHAMTIAGETVPASTTFEVINPSTGEPFAVAPHATQADVDQAVAAAKGAFSAWAATPLAERQDVMLKAHDALAAHSDELVELLVKEQGKPLDAAKAELNLSLQNMKYHATEFDMPTIDLGTNETHKTVVLRKPIGVVAGISKPDEHRYNSTCLGMICRPCHPSLTTLICVALGFAPRSTLELPNFLCSAKMGTSNHDGQYVRAQAVAHDPDDVATHW